VRTARAKGVGERSLLYKHTLRNALIPVVTVLGLQLGQMLGGAVLTETVFAWPGVGRLTVFAIFNRDFVLMQGLVLILAWCTSSSTCSSTSATGSSTRGCATNEPRRAHHARRRQRPPRRLAPLPAQPARHGRRRHRAAPDHDGGLRPAARPQGPGGAEPARAPHDAERRVPARRRRVRPRHPLADHLRHPRVARRRAGLRRARPDARQLPRRPGRLPRRLGRQLVMRTMDLFLAFPYLLLAIIIVSALGRGDPQHDRRHRRVDGPGLRPRGALGGAAAQGARLRHRGDLARRQGGAHPRRPPAAQLRRHAGRLRQPLPGVRRS
jgi:hypothetical protein